MRILLGCLFFFLTACTNPFGGDNSVVDTGHHPGVQTVDSLSPAPGMGFVNSSAQQVVTGRGYKVSQSMGELTTDTHATTSRGYKVFSNVQGSLNSEIQ